MLHPGPSPSPSKRSSQPKAYTEIEDREINNLKRNKLFIGPCKNILAPIVEPRSKLIEEVKKDE